MSYGTIADLEYDLEAVKSTLDSAQDEIDRIISQLDTRPVSNELLDAAEELCYFISALLEVFSKTSVSEHQHELLRELNCFARFGTWYPPDDIRQHMERTHYT